MHFDRYKHSYNIRLAAPGLCFVFIINPLVVYNVGELE